MKLLLDQNLSNRLLSKLEEYFPGSQHVRDLGLHRSSDSEIWNYAALHGYTIVSKDADFHQRSFVKGFPPKVISILGGNCPSDKILHLLSSNIDSITRFSEDPNAAFLMLHLTA